MQACIIGCNCLSEANNMHSWDKIVRMSVHNLHRLLCHAGMWKAYNCNEWNLCVRL